MQVVSCLLQSSQMINKYTGGHQQCQNCRGELLEHIGSQSFCPHCLFLAPNLQHELRVVPEQYESNCRNRRELDRDRKYNALIRQFSDKYRQLHSSDQLGHFRQRLAGIKRVTVRKKGSRQAAAVVVYCEMREDIKMNIKQYCRHNNLSIKIFHQKYKLYRELFKVASTTPESPLLKQEIPLLKIEEKLQQSYTTEKESEQWGQQSEQEGCEQDGLKEEGEGVEGARHAIELIYDEVFNKYIYKQKKVVVVGGLVKRVEETSSRILELIKYNENRPLKLYYLIFAVVKTLGHKISFMDYGQIIKNKTGFLLKRKTAGEVKKIYESKGSTGGSRGRQCKVKVEENGCGMGGKERVDLSDSQLSFQ